MKDHPCLFVGRNCSLSIILENRDSSTGIKVPDRVAGGVCGGGCPHVHALEYLATRASHQDLQL